MRLRIVHAMRYRHVDLLASEGILEVAVALRRVLLPRLRPVTCRTPR
ncbi:hypothetical protein [Amycolatopsis saalfeldensis]|nr:hypothetical protein [Amycolatopsis saalfeldensis]